LANHYFKFKQFTIRQDSCAMKVTTLACIQGAWIPKKTPKRTLDIGAGTGILSLMAAQKYCNNIDAVEIDKEAFDQLKRNLTESPWADRIKCHHNDINDFAKHNSNVYDFIISNPPFFQKQLQSSTFKINQARHETGLRIEQLISICANLISSTGEISILLPPAETERLVELGKQHSLYISNQLVIHDSEKKQTKAIVTILSKKLSNPMIQKLFIKKENGEYTANFIQLLRDYYLKL